METSRCNSFSELRANIEKRTESARKTFVDVMTKNGKVNTKHLTNIVSLEIYNQLFVNDFLSQHICNWVSKTKKMPIYTRKVKQLVNAIEKRRLDYEHYTKRVLTTNDGVWCDVADLFDERIESMVTMININIKQAFDKINLKDSAWRASMETIKLLLNVSIDIGCEVTAGTSIIFGKSGYENKNTDMTDILWSIGMIEEQIGYNPDVENADIDSCVTSFLHRIACAELAMECFKEVGNNISIEDRPEWFPTFVENNSND